MMNAQFPLNNDTSRAYHLSLPVADYQDVILIASLGHPIVSLRPRFLGNVANTGEDSEDVEHASFVVGALERAHGVFLWERRGYGGRDKGRREEGAVGGGRHIGAASVCGGGLPHDRMRWMVVSIEQQLLGYLRECYGVYIAMAGFDFPPSALSTLRGHSYLFREAGSPLDTPENTKPRGSYGPCS